MGWENVSKLIEYPKEGILSKVISKTGKNDVTLFCMAKGTEMSEHHASREGFVFVVEGKGKFTLEGEDIAMLPGVFITMKKGAPHSLRAERNTAFLLSLYS